MKNFQISYTLDVLFFIEAIFSTESEGILADVDQFKPQLGTVSEKYLKKIAKVHQQTPNFISIIASALVINHDLHELTAQEILVNAQKIRQTFKQSPYFKNIPSKEKQFVAKKFTKIIPHLITIIDDLERLGFKAFWLNEKLPTLKTQGTAYEAQLTNFNMTAHLNQFSHLQQQNPEWYVTSYLNQPVLALLNHFNFLRSTIQEKALYAHLIEAQLAKANYQTHARHIKHLRILKDEFKHHPNRSEFQSLVIYINHCIKQALQVYLLSGLPTNESTQTINETDKLAKQILKYLNENPKTNEIDVSSYLMQMMKTLKEGIKNGYPSE